jgi:hypothetical protein
MFRKLLPAVAVVATVGLVGCSPEEKLYDVSGTITYQGQPVPKGIIHFDPDGSGPQGFANIENGKFNTATAGQGKGIRGGGKYTLRVNGFDGKVGPEAPMGAAVFPEHTFSKDLPAQNQTLDYEVPGPKKK